MARDRKAARDAWEKQGLTPSSEARGAAEEDATGLLQLLSSGKLSSEQAMVLACTRAKAVGEALGTNAEECFQEALEEARKCDKERAAGRLRGPLHGLPVSIKDQVDMAGYSSTCGLMTRCGQPAQHDSVLVKMLRDAGAIPFCRTNIPQCLMLPESTNSIWGTACNPHNPARTVGGSSGGEGGLVASFASPLGIGTDIGGSIRIPAFFCGVCGFKPTPQRMTRSGIAVPRPAGLSGQEAVVSSAGPLARSVRDLELVMQAWCCDTMWTHDSTVPRMPWRPEMADHAASGKLRFGYFKTDGFFPPAGVCQRAVTEAVAALEREGHEVVLFELPRGYDAALLYFAMLSADGNMQGFIDGLEGEALHPMYTLLHRMASVPNAVRPLLAAIMRLAGQPRVGDLIKVATQKSTHEFWQVLGERTKYVKEFHAAWKAAKIDALLCPGLGLPAFPHGMARELNSACSYTFLFNTLHLPCGSLPVTTVREGEQTYQGTFGDLFEKKAQASMAGCVGLPIGVQVACLPYEDELCIRAMKIVEQAVGYKIEVPGSCIRAVDGHVDGPGQLPARL